MSAALQAELGGKPQPRSKPDRRRHRRVDLNLGGRFLFNDADHSLQICDVSCGGAKVRSQTLPPEGHAVVCYFDDLGRVVAKVVRHVENGFAMVFEVGAHKRDKLSDRLLWLINHKSFDMEDERTAPRRAGGGPALVTRANGKKMQCRVIDISLTGAAFEYAGPPPLIGEHVRAGTITGEVVRSVTNEFAIRFLYRNKSKSKPNQS